VGSLDYFTSMQTTRRLKHMKVFDHAIQHLLPAIENGASNNNPKRKRGKTLSPSLTLFEVAQLSPEGTAASSPGRESGDLHRPGSPKPRRGLVGLNPAIPWAHAQGYYLPPLRGFRNVQLQYSRFGLLPEPTACCTVRRLC